jgi:hypothetical protein
LVSAQQAQAAATKVKCFASVLTIDIELPDGETDGYAQMFVVLSGHPGRQRRELILREVVAKPQRQLLRWSDSLKVLHFAHLSSAEITEAIMVRVAHVAGATWLEVTAALSRFLIVGEHHD